MKPLRPLLLLSFAASLPYSYAASDSPVQSDERPLKLSTVEVTAHRPLKEIGLTKSTVDSAALKEAVSLSMADILAYNTAIYVKNYGRATLSTVSFRGTSPSHTIVSWNGLPVNSPMLGMTDFSTIPSFFVDGASILHGASSVRISGGGLCGAVRLATGPLDTDGWHATYTQGIGSFHTFDEYGRVGWSDDHWSVSTRVVNSSSRNDYSYTNHDRKENIYDSDHNIIDSYYPRERNRHGAFRDTHLLQEIYYNTLRGSRAGLSVWLTDSRRELPMLSTDYGSAKAYSNTQRDRAVRAAATWDLSRSDYHIGASAGYIHSSLHYDYSREVTTDNLVQMTRSRSRVNTFTLHAEGDRSFSRRLMLSASVDAAQHFVKSQDLSSSIVTSAGVIQGYDKGRAEVSAAVSARYQPTERIGVSATVREEMCGSLVAAPVPALFADWVILPAADLTVRASATRTHKFPTLNDLYFMPGGNPDLKNESGLSWDLGTSASLRHSEKMKSTWSLTWFDSHISDWIQWLPTPKGFFSPRNVKKVHAYGLELKGDFDAKFGRDLSLRLDGNLAWTRSINCGDPLTAADKSVGRQLPYIPEWSSSITGTLEWRSWGLLYKWCYYSERFTMSSNDHTLTGHTISFCVISKE